ncbi:MAG: hypothetical protein QG597_3872 [Actinomycetota bacterium]|nr:hypothetical protein [Actinomycetota bacterium]
MIVASAILVALALGWAAAALFGKPGTIAGFPAQAPLAVPFMAISAGVGLSYGMAWPGAVIAALGVLLALLVPAFLPAAKQAGGDHVGRAAVTWASGTVVTICLGALALSWSASMVEFASDLNRSAVVVVLGLCAFLAALGAGACSNWLRVVAYGSIVVAVLMVVAAVLEGAPTTVVSPALTTTSDGLVPGLAFLVALVVVGAGTPGLRAAAARDRRGLVVTAIVMALVTLAVLLSLLALCGGWITEASYPMFVILGFMPPAVSYVIVAAMTLFGVAGLRRVLADIMAAHPAAQHLVFARVGSRTARWRLVAVGVSAVVIVVLAIVPVPQVLLAAVAAAFAVVSLGAGRVMRSESEGGSGGSGGSGGGGSADVAQGSVGAAG